MPQLHLPADHTDSDLILAGQIAALMRSGELYIAWTHTGGAGAQPAVAAQLREPAPATAEILNVLLDFAADLWRAVMRPAGPASGSRP